MAIHSTEAATVVAQANFRDAWPLDARQVLVKAARTDGEIPAYAEKRVAWAMRVVRAIEDRMERQIAQGEAVKGRRG